MIIAVDGPAGAGKSTVAKILANKLGFLYLDTGAMYRAITLKAILNNLDINDSATIISMARDTRLDLKQGSDDKMSVFLDGQDVSVAIREPRVTRYVSLVAKIKEVRDLMKELQRRLGQKSDCVLDGRDIGTVVFPDADKKFFIDASFQERVNRRYKDLLNLNIKNVSRQEVADDLKNRDTIDSTREVAPLKKADDAYYLDTTELSIEEVVSKMLEEVNKRP